MGEKRWFTMIFTEKGWSVASEHKSKIEAELRQKENGGGCVVYEADYDPSSVQEDIKKLETMEALIHQGIGMTQTLFDAVDSFGTENQCGVRYMNQLRKIFQDYTRLVKREIK